MAEHVARTVKINLCSVLVCKAAEKETVWKTRL